MWTILKVFFFFNLLQYCFCFMFWFLFGHEAYGILAPWPGVEPEPPNWSLNHQTTREVPQDHFWTGWSPWLLLTSVLIPAHLGETGRWAFCLSALQKDRDPQHFLPTVAHVPDPGLESPPWSYQCKPPACSWTPLSCPILLSHPDPIFPFLVSLRKEKLGYELSNSISLIMPRKSESWRVSAM